MSKTKEMAYIDVKGLSKYFGEVAAVYDVDLEVEEGTIFTLLGPSGCGKTTTLRCMAGLERPDAGEISIGDTVVWSSKNKIFLAPDKRNIGMVFQSYAVWPHMSVFDNVAYPLRVRRAPKDEVKDKVKKALELVRLSGLEQRYPSQLSGGQQQRVALARALVYEPEVLLLDEPLSNLDAKLRESMRFELKELQQKLGITAVYVTHDQEEALVIADTLCVMEEGKVMQIGSPAEVYDKPRSKFVADFIGKANFIECDIISECVEHDPSMFCKVRMGGGIDLVVGRHPSLEPKPGRTVSVCVRPEFIDLSTKQPEGRLNTLRGKITKRTFLGDRIEYKLLVGNHTLVAVLPSSVRFDEGTSVCVIMEPEYCTIVRED